MHPRPVVVAAFITVAVVTSVLTAADPPPKPSAGSSDPITRGKYLVELTGCGDCHTPFKMTPQGPAPDMTRWLSGHPAGITLGPPPVLTNGWMYTGSATNTAFAGPWGISYARNLTSDPETGIGFMTADLFVTTMRSGKHLGAGRPILPPMPWQWYAKASDEDLRAIFAYLMSTPPIKNQAPESVPALPPPPHGKTPPPRLAPGPKK